ncbi:DUF4178 domain-containing protein [Enterococcus ureasiticus]|uniref:DUF4178 domain-containing protein n=1 Tax=Enterococcus ureasiticus TaxID=903984 RepID=A0A1E5G9U1_9ENTE|nr:DUF4178 domain-containing protein [Enterococcus ureasiticus]OEG09476.1 hypothetical protein BCR21_14070 [Enterococcus ureasiticus]
MNYDMLLGEEVTVEAILYKINGIIEFQQGNYCWREFKLVGENQNIKWLSIDKDNPDESYSLFQSAAIFFSLSTPEYEGEKYVLAESGSATVIAVEGEVDAELNERMTFKEFHSKTDDKKLLSYEKWSDETEYSSGKMILASQIEYHGAIKENNQSQKRKVELSTLNKIKKGQEITIGKTIYRVVGWANYRQGSYSWIEYRLLPRASNKESWLVVEPQGNEYVLSLFKKVGNKQVTLNTTGSQAIYKNKTYNIAETGTAVVTRSSGDVDFDPNEKVSFSDFTNQKNEILSKEKWSDGVEYSYGRIINDVEFELLEFVSPPFWKNEKVKKTMMISCIALIMVFFFALSEGLIHFPQATIEKQVRESRMYEEVTNVTFKDSSKTKSKIYKSDLSVDQTCENLIELDPERILYVTTDKENIEQGEKMIQTKKETVLIYIGENQETYIQIFPNKDYQNSYSSYNAGNHGRLRSFYVNSRNWGNNKATTNQPEPYSDGSIERSIDASHYSGSVASARQNSINARKKDGGGTGFGK